MAITLQSEALKLSEHNVTQQITSYLRARGWRCWRMQSGMFHRGRDENAQPFRVGEEAMPDWLALRPAPHVNMAALVQAIWLEIKAPGKKPRRTRLKKHRRQGRLVTRVLKGQDQYLLELQIAGFEANWFDSLDERDGGKKPFRTWYEKRFGSR